MQEKSNQDIDLTFKIKSLQQSLELEEAEHKATKAKLADKSTIYKSIEEEKSQALKGQHNNNKAFLVPIIQNCCSFISF